MHGYRTYLIDLDGSNTYFDPDEGAWYSLEVLAQRGGEIVQVVTVPSDQIKKFKGWDEQWKRRDGELTVTVGGEAARIPAIAVVRFAFGSPSELLDLTPQVKP